MLLTIYVIILMIGASLIGFCIAWVMRQPAFSNLSKLLSNSQSEHSSLKTNHENLVGYANQLQKEKEQLLHSNEKLTEKLISLTNTTNRLKAQKVVIFDKYENDMIDTASFDYKINDLNAEIGKLNAQIDEVKHESMQWQIKYNSLQKEKEALEQKLNSNNPSA